MLLEGEGEETETQREREREKLTSIHKPPSLLTAGKK